MAKRRDPDHKEYNPLDDARGRLPIDADLVRDVMGGPAAATTPAPEARPIAPAPVPAVSPPSTPPVAVPSPDPAPPRHRPITVEKLTKYNKFLTTPREKLELERLAARISGALGVSVRPSHLIRACLIHLLHAENEIVRRAEEEPQPKRPSNTESVALAEFDQMIAGILSHGFRQAGPLRARSLTSA